MTAFTHIFNVEQGTGIRQINIEELLKKLSGYFWFVLSFLLFLVMGPFSAIAVVMGLWSLSRSEEVRNQVEPREA